MIPASVAIYFHPRIITIALLGFSSGLPLALTSATLGFWLAEAGVSLKEIAIFGLVATPYALKFLWAPLMDAAPIPVLHQLLGRRRSWLIVTQSMLMASLIFLGLSNPVEAPWWMALAAVLVAFSSASQDIVIDAYRVEILKPEQYGAGAAAIIFGYRMGMIAAGAGALMLSKYYGWELTYMVMAALVLVGMATVLLNKEPEVIHEQTKARQHGVVPWLYHAVVMPFSDFMRRKYWLGILLFILLYKMADAFMGVMANPFYVKIGFDKADIATIVKVYGVIATIVGGFIGGSMVLRLGMVRSLWICGIAQMLTNLMFSAQALIGPDTGFLALTITLENLSGGMGGAAFVAFMSRLCNVQFTATQYALLSSFASFGRTWLSAPAGWFAEGMGWPVFFAFSTVLGIPGLICLWWLSRKINIENSDK